MAEKKPVADVEEEVESNSIGEYDTNDDPVITDAFASMKNAILSQRTDIVRQIICAAESIREEDYDSEDEAELDKKAIRDKYDSEEYIDMLSLLLRHKDTDSGTLLHIATRVNSADIVRTLLAAGSNCLVENQEHKNPYQYCSSDLVQSAYVGELMQAVSQSRLFRVEQLVNAGISIQSCDAATSMNSVLHWGVSFADLPTIRLLIERGGEIDARNGHGSTPLHDAVHRGDATIVEELLKHGADVNVCAVSGPYKGKSPKDLSADIPHMKELFNLYALECNGEVKLPLENGDLSVPESFQTDHNGNVTPKTSAVSLTPKRKSSLTCPVSVSVDPMVNYLCPLPQRVKQFRGLFFVPPEKLTVYIKSSQDDIIEMNDILELFVSKFQKIGIKLSCEFLSPDVKMPSKSSHMQCIINRNCFSRKEEYKIQINTHEVFIISSCLPSLFYGLSTFLQCLKLFRGKAVPLLQISDWPQCSQRSVMFDFHQNDIPKIDILLESIDQLAMFKINQIQFNVDHFCGDNGAATYTRSESLQLHIYCKKRFISLVPYIRIDHGSPLLRCARSNGVPELSVDALAQRTQVFPFLKTIHVELVLTENQKLIQQLYRYCNKNGYIFQVTSKEVDIQLDLMPTLLNGVVCTIDASATNQWKDHVTSVNELGLQYITCYDCTDINRIYPDIKELVSNAHSIFSQPPLCNCSGVSIKFSHRAKRLFIFMTLLPSLFISSSMLWNLNEMMMDGMYILNVINYLIYEDDKDLVGSMFIEVGKSLPLFGKEVPHPAFEDEEINVSVFDDMVEFCSVDVTSLNSSSLQKICKTVKVMKQSLLLSKVECSSSEMFHQETSIVLNTIFLLARICYRMLSLRTKIENVSLENLPQVNKSDESNRLMLVIREYKAYCSTYCKSSPNGCMTLTLLDDLLNKIIPKDTSNFTLQNIINI